MLVEQIVLTGWSLEWRTKPMHLWPVDVWKGMQGCSMESESSFEQNAKITAWSHGKECRVPLIKNGSKT